MSIEKLSKDFWKGKKYHYIQIEDLEGWYIYKAEIHYKDGMVDSSYEVFKKRIAPKSVFCDGRWKKVENVEAEIYPSTEHWGNYAWTCMTLERCHDIIRSKNKPDLYT